MTPILLKEAVSEAYREDGEKAGVAQIVVVARFKGGQALLEAGVLIDGLTTYRGRVVRIAGAACECHLEARLANIVEAQLDREADAAAVSRDDVAEAETKTWRDFVEVDTSGAVERVCVAADVVLAAERDRASRGDDGGREDAVVIAEN
jgi:hypothetical protein